MEHQSALQGSLDIRGDATKDERPIECLGLTFKNDAERREHFLGVLREKLKDPEFRNTPGFPKGSDDDILRLSDPPCYTACPKPFLDDFLSSFENQAVLSALPLLEPKK